MYFDAKIPKKLHRGFVDIHPCNFVSFPLLLHLNLYYKFVFGVSTMSFLSSLFGPPLPSLNALELSEKLKAGNQPLVIDVRQPEEYREGHIAGSKLIPLGELDRRVNELPKGQEIICVCASGSRSRSATKFLIDAGYAAFDMNGGMFMWQRAQLPIQKGSTA
jgi:rhodanese-related sulfurtransferase